MKKSNVRKIPSCASYMVALACIFLMIAVSSASALEVPPLKTRVNDYANLLSTATTSQLEQSLAHLENTDSTQIAVLTIPSLEGENLEQFSLKTVEKWKLGQSNLDNGALLLVAYKERKIRIEVGYGLEGSLTDLRAGRIIRNIILPRFKQGDFDQGIIDGVTAMSKIAQGEFVADGKIASLTIQPPQSFFIFLLCFFMFFGSIMINSKILITTVCGLIAPVVGTLLYGDFNLPLIIGLIPAGIICGLILSKLDITSGNGSGSSSWGSSGGYSGGSFGSSGGFSGGGGSFGGGGASGGW